MDEPSPSVKRASCLFLGEPRVGKAEEQEAPVASKVLDYGPVEFLKTLPMPEKFKKR